MTAPEIDSSEGIKIGDVLIHAGDVDGRDVSVDGTKLDIIDGQMSGILQKYIISDNVLQSNDNSFTSTATSYTKLRTIAINALHPTPSTLRIYFELSAFVTPGNVYGKIYKNGIAFGTERTTSSTSCVYFSEDLSFAEGDTIELWGYKTNPAAAVLVEDFRVLGDDDNLTLAEAINGSDAGVADAWDATNS